MIDKSFPPEYVQEAYPLLGEDQKKCSEVTFDTLRRTKLCKVERSGSGVELRILDYENPGSNPGCGVKTLGKFFHSTLLQFTQLN